MEAIKVLCCFGDIIEDNCGKKFNYITDFEVPPLGSHNDWTKGAVIILKSVPGRRRNSEIVAH